MDAYDVKHKSRVNTAMCVAPLLQPRETWVQVHVYTMCYTHVYHCYIARVYCLKRGTWRAQKVLPLILSYV